jgi:hypothetical protein
MQNAIVVAAIQMVARLILGSDVFGRILMTVERWAQKKIEGAEKRAGVLDELEVIGLKLAESAARLGVELAVQVVKRKAE